MDRGFPSHQRLRMRRLAFFSIRAALAFNSLFAIDHSALRAVRFRTLPVALADFLMALPVTFADFIIILLAFFAAFRMPLSAVFAAFIIFPIGTG